MAPKKTDKTRGTPYPDYHKTENYMGVDKQFGNE